jgi:shikimate kinase
MGSGKSTIGRILAKQLEHSYFLDTDSLIEHFENREISEIFSTDGEEYFRDAEKKVFNWIKNDVKNAIISTGGGLPMFVPEIKEAGIVIYLKVEFQNIVARLTDKEIEKRPLFKDLDKAQQLFNKRDEIYTKLADFVIENNNLETSILKIEKIIKTYS